MPRIKKSKKIEQKEYHKEQKLRQTSQKHKQDQEWSQVMHSTQNNMSEGALNTYRIQKSRNHWGNKQLWGHKDKGRHKPGRSSPKATKH